MGLKQILILGELRHWNGRLQTPRLYMGTGEHRCLPYIDGLTIIAYLVPIRILFHKTRQRTSSPVRITNVLSQTYEALTNV